VRIGAIDDFQLAALLDDAYIGAQVRHGLQAFGILVLWSFGHGAADPRSWQR